MNYKLLFVIFFIALISASPDLYSQCLNGTYTIGGTNPDYTSIALAVNDLNNQGICGPVIFNIRPGNYRNTSTLNQISGSSPNNTLTFRAENGDSSSVIIEQQSLNHDFIFKLRGTKYVSFENLSFDKEATDHFCFAFVLENGASDIHFSNCSIEGEPDVYALIFITEARAITIENCYFEGSVRGIGIQNTFNSPLVHNVRIQQNDFYNSYIGILVTGADSIFIRNNQIRNTRQESINCDKTNFVQVEANFLSSRSIFANIGRLAPEQINLFANNFCYGNSRIRNLFLLNAAPFNIVYNTFYCTNTNPQFANLDLINCDSIEILNNIFIQKNQSGFISFNDSISNKNYVIDYNGYERPDGYAVRVGSNTYQSLANFSSATGFDTHSFVDTFYTIPPQSNLHLVFTDSSNVDIWDRGTPLSYVTTDADGESRHPVHPDVGADEIEFAIPSYDLAVAAIELPDTVCPGSHDMYISIENLSDTIIDRYQVFISQDGQLIDSIDVDVSRHIDSITLAPFSITPKVIKRKIFIQPQSTSHLEAWVKMETIGWTRFPPMTPLDLCYILGLHLLILRFPGKSSFAQRVIPFPSLLCLDSPIMSGQQERTPPRFPSLNQGCISLQSVMNRVVDVHLHFSPRLRMWRIFSGSIMGIIEHYGMVGDKRWKAIKISY